MSNDLRDQIYFNLNQKGTDELVEIWHTNDRVDWTELAFDVIQEILLERIGILPDQDEPVVEHVLLDTDHVEAEDSGEENRPYFYKPDEVLWLDKWLNRATIAAIVVTILSEWGQLSWFQSIVSGLNTGILQSKIISWLIAAIIFILLVGTQSAIYYVSFKAMRVVLRILMEMEFNSRGAN